LRDADPRASSTTDARAIPHPRGSSRMDGSSEEAAAAICSDPILSVLLTAQVRWLADNDRVALRRDLLALLISIEHPV
jgi:hypothetical protein